MTAPTAAVASSPSAASERRPRLSAAELIDITLDPSSFESWDTPAEQPPVDQEYAAQLAAAAEASGTDEAVVTGAGLLHGRRVAVIVSEFRFLGGSIGVVAARRIVAAVERATSSGLPILAAPASGGTRMQEGTVAFLQMATITQAVTSHKEAGLPYLVYLRHPTTGGVFASWGSLGHITVAEPDALIGFLGPKVYRQLRGEDFPSGVQTGENLFGNGIVDAVLSPHHLRTVASRVLATANARTATRRPAPAPTPAPSRASAWESIEISRHPGRPGVRSFLRHAAENVTWLNGTGQGEAGGASRTALATFGGRGAVVVALDRHAQSHSSDLGPGALRQARRGMELAAGLHLPLVTVIDTPGAALSREAEEGGLGGEIARCLAELLALRVPTVAVLMGEGTGGGALALTPTDRVIAAEHGWLAPLPPEGASVIRFGDVGHAAQLAEEQNVSATDLHRTGIVDEVVPELPDASRERTAFCIRLGHAVERQLEEICSTPTAHLLARRRHRYATLGD